MKTPTRVPRPLNILRQERNTTLGRHIREMRELSQLRQEDVVARIPEMTQQRLSKIENGRVMITALDLEDLGRAIGIRITGFFYPDFTSKT